MADSAGTIQDQSGLDAQIAKERAELINAPKVPVSQLQKQSQARGQAGRCAWCGKFSQDVVYVDTIHGQERFKGVECCGGRHL